MPIIPIKKLTAITFAENEDELILTLGKVGAVDLRPLREKKEFAGFEKRVAAERKKCDELLSRLRALCERAGIPEPKAVKVERIPTVEEVEEDVKAYEERFDELDRRFEETTVKRFILILRKHGIEPSQIGEMRVTFLKVGLVDKELVGELEEKAKEVKAFIRWEEVSEKEALVMCGGLVEYKDAVMRVLKELGFKEVEIPKEIPKDLAVPDEEVGKKLSEIEAEIKKLEDERKKLVEELSANAPKIKGSLMSLRKMSDIKSQLFRSKTMVLIQGWVSEEDLDRVRETLKELRDRWGGRLAFFFDDPAPGETPPTVLKNPRIFKPYERLVGQYGVPSMDDIDPTAVSGILWTIMFGLMFPDLGQGIALIALGVLFRWKIKSFLGMRTRTLGTLLIAGGITAAFFGALLGDFFLYEIKPLWPWLSHAWLHTQGASAIVWLLKIALFFGVAQVIMAYILSIYRNLRAGHTHEAIWGERGLPALIVFVSIVAIAFMFIGMTVIPGVLRIPGVGMAVFTRWPYCLSLGGLIVGLVMIVMGPIVGGEGDVSAAGGAVIETLISSISNMLSYIRVAGFCVAHVAFAAVTVTMLESMLMFGISIGLIFLNFFCLTLEVIVIMIQSLRLTFYEFMTKFYEGAGYRFRPLRI